MEDFSTKNNVISSDDQELAKVLAGVDGSDEEPEPVLDPEPEEEVEPVKDKNVPDLTAVREKALQDIKPLLGKLDVPADEKFDIYMEVLRISEDYTLIEPAYEITPDIKDETRRADDLLAVIRTIDSVNPPTVE